MLSYLTHRKIFIFFLIILSVGLTMGKLLMSISMIGLSANWLIEGGYKEKWRKNIDLKHTPIILSGIFFLEIVWLIFAKDTGLGLSSLRIKLPLLVLPIVLGTSEKLNNKEIKTLITTFLLGVLFSTVVAHLVDMGFVNKKTITKSSRDISIFMSHIRYSVILSFSIFLMIHLLINKKVKILFGIILILWILILIYKMSSLTAFIALFVGAAVFLLHSAINSKNKTRIVLAGIFFSILFFTIFSIATIIKDHYSPKENSYFNQMEEFTVKGERYVHLNRNDLENGFYIWKNIAEKELGSYWTKRSEINFGGRDKKNQNIKNTIYRYLTSKGLKKDSLGLSKLSDEEIIEIENGETTAIKYNLISKRIRELLFEIDNFKKTKNPNNHSLTQRITYWKIGFEIFMQASVFGHGSGNHKYAYRNYYSNNDTILDKKNQRNAHNQFLTHLINFGFVGFFIWILLITIPSIRVMAMNNPFYISCVLLFYIAFLSDDMLERQAGVTIFATIFYVIIFTCNDKYIKRLFFLEKYSE